MSKVTLVKPSAALADAYQQYQEEWVQAGEKMIPTATQPAPVPFAERLISWHNEEEGINIPAGWVKASLFFLVDENNRILGASHIRHDLTEDLFKIGGHVGYGVRPSERKKGYATEILKQSLVEVRKLGIKEVLVTCNDDNTGSAKAIEANGGVRDQDEIEEDGTVIRRYWIKE
ncbi:GNAT family N-acetyltransferase [Jeotgalibacillus sp. R-1-5s-1]|uniref:GNAT family N-acetyltransferase n=1 Tax=Jeotgalibacillus sp. R-1-5s-1 TaxID=2555897 RepID=UPI00106902B8|nr:GNAT family N-acetyltransferase [Jeotgalibacillus sp. R-1-5s-1]TFD99982.1 GNAT family N-acetyltransferase [Jeotgalibacillus sp. R-1-5s-1]